MLKRVGEEKVATVETGNGEPAAAPAAADAPAAGLKQKRDGKQWNSLLAQLKKRLD